MGKIYDDWVEENKIDLSRVRKSKHQNSIIRFVEICVAAIKEGRKIKLNQTIRDFKICTELMHTYIKRYGLQSAIRSKGESSIQDKVLPLEDAQKRLPNQENKVIGFENGKYIVKAVDGFIYYKTSAKLYQGDPRGKCGKIWNIDQIRAELLRHGYELVDDSYKIKRKSLQARCLGCGEIRQNRFKMFFEQECPSCNHTLVSKGELEVGHAIRDMGFEVTRYYFNREKTKKPEIDIFIPKLNIGIEYNGLRYHSDAFKSDKNYHYSKMIEARECGIRLINIFEDEWKKRQKQVLNYIKSVLGVYTHNIYARKCEIKEVEKLQVVSFLDENHIQGSTQFKVAFGLYFENELVAIMTGSNHHRNGNKGLFVLSRLCFKDGYKVVGGSSKLLKKLLDYCRVRGYAKLVSWSDNRWSIGGVYERMGFLLENEMKPDYSYTYGNARFSKQSCTKKNLLKKILIKNEKLIKAGKPIKEFSMANTEVELATYLCLNRIWDCGKKRWVINLK